MSPIPSKGTEKRNFHFIVISLVVALCLTVGLLLHTMFSRDISDLTTEILAAVLGVVLVVASVGVTIHYQSRFETEKEFRRILFEFKIKAYEEVIQELMDATEDGKFDRAELEWIDAAVAKACLVGDKGLIEVLLPYSIQCHGASPSTTREITPGEVIQALRNDLQVESQPEEEQEDTVKGILGFWKTRQQWIAEQEPEETDEHGEELDDKVTELRIENRRLKLELDAILSSQQQADGEQPV